MKKIVLGLGIVLTSFVACKKSTDGNKNILAQENENSSNTTTEESKVYIGLEKSKAKVTFKNSPKENTITIEANNQKFVLDKKETEGGKTIYERNGIKAEVKKDSLYIIQDDNVIPMAEWNP